MIGPAASVPDPPTLVVALPESENDHTCFNCETFAIVIVEPKATRVFARLAFGNGQDPDVLVPLADWAEGMLASKAQIKELITATESPSAARCRPLNTPLFVDSRSCLIKRVLEVKTTPLATFASVALATRSDEVLQAREIYLHGTSTRAVRQ